MTTGEGTIGRRSTLHAMHREVELTAARDGKLPGWLFSPPTPDKPERIEAGANGAPPADGSVVVDCAGSLYDRIVLYRPHAHTLRVPDRMSPMLRAFFRRAWDDCEDDGRPENRERRAALLALAAEAGGGAEVDRRRAWRVIDWQVRVHAPEILALAGFEAHAEAYRVLPEITGPELPRGAVRAFREAHRDTDKASTIALGRADEGRRERRMSPFPHLASALELAACATFPEIDAMVREWGFKSKTSPIGLGLLAKGHARVCVKYARSISAAALRRTTAALEAAEQGLVREVIGMQSAKRAAA